VILADEPTAPLDSDRAMAVIRILNEMARKFETAIIVVTHDEKIIPTFKRIYHIRDGITHEEAGEGRGFEDIQGAFQAQDSYKATDDGHAASLRAF
jgi:putative ABC transport system ATP-binding protein